MAFTIEGKLRDVQDIAYKKNLVVSCDLYYNNITRPEERWVAKVWINSGKPLHFRASSLRKALNAAIAYLRVL